MVLKTSDKPGMWQVFGPFTEELWIAFIFSVVIGAIIMYLIRKVSSGENVFSWNTVKSFPGYLYHNAAAFLDADDYNLYHDPQWGRLYRLGMLFLVLVFIATYTAKLVSLLYLLFYNDNNVIYIFLT